MGFFGWMFWLLPFFFMMMVMRRRRWERWQAPPARDQRELDDQRGYIESLESRVTQLEERLDFTERLLATRSEAAAPR
jgi:hypothetical protein